MTDIELTLFGEEQALLIPRILANLEISPITVLSSPRIRAQRTAEIAGFVIDHVLEDLVEWNYGEYEGITTPDIWKAHPSWSLFTHGTPGGESPAQIGARADRALAFIRRQLDFGDVLVFCHGHMSRVLAVRWAGLGVGVSAVIALDPASVTVLGTHHGQPIIEHANVPDPLAH